MASDREMGWQAFQRGDLPGAISLLESACRADSGDFDAHMYLGAAYGKVGRTNDAVSSITKAVQLQPSNPQARYNLGVALENAGFLPQAMEAMQQAVVLAPDYSKAKEALQRLQQQDKLRRLQTDPGASPNVPAPASSEFIGNPPDANAHSVPYVQPPAQMSGGYPEPPPVTQSFATPEDRQGSQVSMPSAPGFNGPTPSAPGYEPPGSLPRTTALPSYGLLSDYSPSPNSPAGPTALPDPYPTVLPPPNYQDELDFIQAFKDFGQILIAPVRFFTSQAGRQGFMSPICMLGVYLVIGLLETLLSSGAQGIVGVIASLFFLPIQLAAILCGMMISYLILALMVHFLGMMFGNRTDYSVSFRAVVYADAPRILLGVLFSAWMAFVLAPSFRDQPITTQEFEDIMRSGRSTAGPNPAGSPRSPFPLTAKPGAPGFPTSPASPSESPTRDQLMKVVSLVISRKAAVVLPVLIFGLAGWIWSTTLLIVAIHKMQNISPGAAFAVWFIMFLIGAALLALMLYAFYSVVAFLISLALQMSGGSGGIPPH